MSIETRRDPARNAFAITPTDNTNLSHQTRAIYIGGAGDLAVILAGDTAAVTFAAVNAGTILPLAVSVVMSTNTTASNIVGIY